MGERGGRKKRCKSVCLRSVLDAVYCGTQHKNTWGTFLVCGAKKIKKIKARRENYRKTVLMPTAPRLMRFAPACGRETGDERCEAISARTFGSVSGCESHETDRRAAAAAEDTLTMKAHQHIPDTSHEGRDREPLRPPFKKKNLLVQH